MQKTVAELQKETLKSVEDLNVLVKQYRTENEAMKEADVLSKNKMEKMEKDLLEILEKYDSLLAQSNHIPTKGYDGQPRTKEAEMHVKAFGEWCSKGMKGLSPEHQKALVEDATGQYLVPEELERMIYRELPEITIMRNLASVMTVKTNILKRATLTDVSVGWGALETGSDLTVTGQTPANAYQYIEELNGLAKIGRSELMDAFVNLERELMKAFGEALAEAEDTGFMVGTGHDDKEPEGIFDDDSGITVVRTASATALTFDDIYDLTYDLPDQYRARNPSFLMNSVIELVLIKLRAGGSTTGDGMYLWKPAPAPGLPNTLNGYNVYNQGDIPSTLTANYRNVAFGDYKSGYRILDRQGMTMQRLNEKYSDQGMVGFQVNKRVTGGVVRPSAIRILQQKAT